MNAGNPPSRNWRAQPPARTAYAREWRGERGRPPSRLTRRTKLRLIAFGLAVLVSTIILLLMPGAGSVPPTHIVTFGIGAYGGRSNPQWGLPVNAFGEGDASAFRVLHKRNPAQFPSVKSGRDALGGAAFRRFLQTEAAATELAGHNLIVFCTMHGLVQPSGEVELFAIDATAESPDASSSTMIPLREVIASLQESSARHVLLALDVSRLEADWRLGILVNDVAEQIQRDFRANRGSAGSGTSNTGKVTLLLAAGAGQQSRGSDGQSMFVQSLIEGLGGAADGWAERDGRPIYNARDCDRRVSLHELAAYMRRHVSEWSRRHTGMDQTVQLAGNLDNPVLAVVSPPLAEEDATETQVVSETTDTEERSEADAAQAQAVKSADSSASQPAAEKEVEKEAKKEKPPEPPLEVRLAQLWKKRDEFTRRGGPARDAACRRAPYTWRTFEAQLHLAEALRQGGLPGLAGVVLRQAEARLQKLTDQTEWFAEFQRGTEKKLHSDLQSLGLTAQASDAVPPEVIAEAEQFLRGLVAEKPPAAAQTPPVESPPAARDKSPPPSAAAIQAWFIQELSDPVRGSDPANVAQLQQIQNRLQTQRLWPQTAACAFLFEVLSASTADSRPRGGLIVRDMLALRDRFRQLAVRLPESLPLVEEPVRQGLRTLDAAERWLIATEATQPEVRNWMEKAREFAEQAERGAEQAAATAGVFSDLLAELPELAEWIATRAIDDRSRPMDWDRLRELAKVWRASQRDGRWDVTEITDTWPDRPAEFTGLERLLLTLLIDAHRCRIALQVEREGAPESASRPHDSQRLAEEVANHRAEFWRNVQQSISTLGISTRPTPSAWREIERLLAQRWPTLEERQRLETLQRLAPRGEPLPDRHAARAAVWQGFFAIATLSLFEESSGELDSLWQSWDELVVATQAADQQPEAASADALRFRRVQLGRLIRQQWNRLQKPASTTGEATDIVRLHLAAAALDPASLPAVDPDVHFRERRRQYFAQWLALLGEDWHRRSTIADGPAAQSYLTLADSAQRIAGELGADASLGERDARVRIQEVQRIAFNPQRRGRLEFAMTGNSPAGPPLKAILTQAPLRVVQGDRRVLVDGTELPIPATGPFSVEVELSPDVTSTEWLLVAITEEADGYPLEFRRIPLQPPFDPTTWRIAFVEAETGVPLESTPIPGVNGSKLFLAPAATIACRAELIRPDRDSTASAKVAVYRLTGAGRVPLLPAIDITLEPGRQRTPIPFDVPVSEEAATQAPVAKLDRGWVFEITPAGEQPLEYHIQPAFWSAEKFLKPVRPELMGDRVTLSLERRTPSKEIADEVLLPQQIDVRLQLPAWLEGRISDYTPGGPLGFGQQLTLGFTLPPDWRERAVDATGDLALEVAGLPHASCWRIHPSGNISVVGGQPPRLDIRLLESNRPDVPPRKGPILRKGKESLKLRFEVDSTELDRSEGAGDWTLAYLVQRESESGTERALPGKSWRLYSSLEQHTRLDSLQKGVWRLTTSANDYEHEVPETELRGFSGRFQVQAALYRADAPQHPQATASLRFAIDDEAPPTVQVTGLTDTPRRIDQELVFRIEAADPESGIEWLAFGFDQNGDRQLQEDPERISVFTFEAFDHPRVTRSIRIPASRLPKLEQAEETRHLLVQASNGLGIVGTRIVPITFRKPPMPRTATIGSLAVTFRTARGARATIQLTGPKPQLVQAASGSHTFTDLPPGQYQVKVNVTYALTGQKEAGEGTFEVKAGATTPASIPLSAVK